MQRAILLGFLAGLSASVISAQGVITTVSGTDLFFPPVSAFPAQDLPLQGETGPGMTVDQQGNLILASFRLCQVLRISPPGLAETIAGNGICGGFAGDGGPALKASVNPQGIAIDAAGNLYISEYNRVRRVTPNGIISSLSLSSPVQIYGAANSIVARPDGTLYFVDQIALHVGRISPNGTVSIVAGNGQSGDCTTGPAATAVPLSPRSLALDATGNVYVNVSGSFAVCRISPDGSITRLNPALRSEAGLAVARNGDLLASNPFDGVVYRVSPNGQIGIAAGTLNVQGSTGDGGPATQASICPSSLAVAPDDSIYIWDACGQRLRRRLASTGVIVAVAGTLQLPGSGEASQTAAIGTPQAVAADSRGNVYIGVQNRVLRVSSSGVVTPYAGTGENRTAA